MWLSGVVIAHLGISMIHGAAHAQAHIPMSRAANLFVFVVILAGPPIGLALALRSRRVGAWVIGITMAASLLFGFVNHFVLAGADHVAHVDPRWRTLFTATAVLVAITEALGSVLAVRVAREPSLT
jgi:NADPH-dependent 2,4-dienoyl-CoA reductase/sulfur reductase-like enzyme